MLDKNSLPEVEIKAITAVMGHKCMLWKLSYFHSCYIILDKHFACTVFS